MQLTIPFTELADLIRKETGQALGLAYKSPDEMVVSYNARFGLFSKQIQAGVRLMDVSNDKIELQLDFGMLTGMLDCATSFLQNKLPSGLLESFSNGHGTLRLSAIPQLQPVLDRLEIDGVRLDPESLCLDARTK